MPHTEVKMNFFRHIFHLKVKLPVLLLFFVFCISTFLVSCNSGLSEPTVFKGRILLFYAGDEAGGDYFKSTGFAPGIYELTPDQQSPQLLWGDLPVQLDDAYPIISPDGNFALLQSLDPFLYTVYYLVNLQTGEGHVILNPGSGYTVFSPDNRYLAHSDGSSLTIIDIQSDILVKLDKAAQSGYGDAYSAQQKQTLTLLSENCTYGSNCHACLPVENPVWVNDETIVVVTDSRYLDKSFSFPEGSACGINGNLDMFIVTNLDGTVTTDYLASSKVDLALKNTNPNLINTTIIVRDSSQAMNGWNSLSWVDSTAIVDRGKIVRNSIGYINPDLFSVSLDGKKMLWYKQQWESYDLASRKTTRLGKDPEMERIYNCAWSPEGEAVACLGLVRNGNIQLFMLPFSGQDPLTLSTWDKYQTNFGWYLLGWQS